MIAAHILNTKASFSNANDGDTQCFKDLDGFISSNTTRFLIYVAIFVFAVHDK